MKKRYIVEIIAFVVLAGVIALSILAISLLVSPPNNSAPNALPLNILHKTAKPANSISLVLDFGDGAIKTLSLDLAPKMTAFDLLSQGAQKNKIPVTTKISDMGTFVQAIGDKQGGQGGKYWMYYVNSLLANVGADKYELKAGDRVEWKFEKPSF